MDRTDIVEMTSYPNTNLWIKANTNQILSDILLNTRKNP